MQTMLTVVTQNSRLPRRSALSGDRLAFGFGYPHCSVPDARCQVSPGFLAKSVTCSRQIQPISQPLPNSSRATKLMLGRWASPFGVALCEIKIVLMMQQRIDGQLLWRNRVVRVESAHRIRA